jgi:hypothetical protein
MKFTSIVLAFTGAANQFTSTFAALNALTAVVDNESTGQGKSFSFNVLANDLIEGASGDRPLDLSRDGALESSDMVLNDLTSDLTLQGGTVDFATFAADGTIVYTVTDGSFIGTESFEYGFGCATSGSGGDCSASAAITGISVTIKVLADVKQVFSNPLAASSSEAPKITYKGLKGVNSLNSGGLGDAAFENLFSNLGSKTKFSDESVKFVNKGVFNIFNDAGDAFGDFKPVFNVNPDFDFNGGNFPAPP